MQYGKLKLGLVAATSIAASLTLAAQPAFADYAPTARDAVGVGSDTLQNIGDFVADGDFLGDGGYNQLGNKYKLISFDATPDANVRLAYGPDGLGDASGKCAPGTGGTAGTGNDNTKHADNPCTLNPTIVLQQGLSPVQRPNGSGGGAKAAATDSHHYIDYTRASSAQGATLGTSWDSITVGTDPLAMATASTTNAPPLSAAQLKLIYACTDTTWTSVGGASSDTIVPIVPQVGSGTRSSFLTAIGNPTLGGCVKTAEENDPQAIIDQGANAIDAIEPLSGGRLNLFQGKLGSGASNGVGGYFKDPSCSLNAIAASTPANCAAASNTLTPDVKLTTTGSPSDSNPLFDIARPLYIYFRHADISAAQAFQPGGTLNLVRTLFYNPCPDNPPVAGDGCTTVGPNTFGPGGAPYYASSAGQALVSAAGISPTYSVTIAGP